MQYVKQVEDGQVKLAYNHGSSVNYEGYIMTVIVEGKIATDPAKVAQYTAYAYTVMLVVTRTWIMFNEGNTPDASAIELDKQVMRYLATEGFKPVVDKKEGE